METALLLTHLILCSSIFWAGFCRLSQVDSTTSWKLRASLRLDTIISMALILAPFFWGLVPTLWMCVLLISKYIRYLTTIEAWHDGVPVWARES